MFQKLIEFSIFTIISPWIMFFASLLCIIWTFVTFYIPKQVSNPNRQTKRMKQYENELKMHSKGDYETINSDLNSNLKIKPDWLDIDKVKRGQEFARKYYTATLGNIYVSMYLLLAHEKSVQTLVNTRKSHTVKDSGERYLRTLHHLTNWYECDLTDESSKALRSIRAVNKYHMQVERRMNKKSVKQIEEETQKILNEFKMKYINLHKQAINVIELNNAGLESPELDLGNLGPKMSQNEMFVTQWAFFGLIFMYPEKYGVDPKDDMESFVHLWRYLGYLFGVREEYNICSGTLEEVKRKCDALVEFLLLPLLKNSNIHYEHMIRCMTEGMNKYLYILRIKSTMAVIFYFLDFEFTDYFKNLSFLDKLFYYIMVLSFKMHKYAIPRTVMNWVWRKVIEIQSNILIKNGEKSLVV